MQRTGRDSEEYEGHWLLCHIPWALDSGFSQPWVPADTNTDLRKPVSDPRSAGIHQAHFLLPFLGNAP